MPAAPSLASRETSSPRCSADVVGSQSPLTKAGAERLLAAIDTEALFDAVVGALRWVLDLDATHVDDAVLARAVELAGWSGERASALRARNADVLTSIAIDLCELRVLVPEQRSTGEQH